LNGGASLIGQTLTRASGVVSRERIIAVVAPEHDQFWRPALRGLPSENIIVQPLNRGTAIGILLPTLKILARDPEARLLILPSDHHVADEATLKQAMCHAIEDVHHHPAGLALLGIEADEPDPELGYIVPRFGSHSRLGQVQRFVEKPPIAEARRLCSDGALWNSFILAGRAASLVGLCTRRCPKAVQRLQAIDLHDYGQLLQAYSELPVIDFSLHIATGQESRLAVLAVPPCGWNDLGTPHRLARTLARNPKSVPSQSAAAWRGPAGCINLAERLLQVQFGLRAD
jgi:mannose-1-phosphate guanylyltransferase